MLYDPDRTRSIIDRIVLLGNNLRLVTMLTCAGFFGLLAGILGVLAFDGLWFALALVGLILGLAVGQFVADALSVVLEWMAQMLIRLDSLR